MSELVFSFILSFLCKQPRYERVVVDKDFAIGTMRNTARRNDVRHDLYINNITNPRVMTRIGISCAWWKPVTDYDIDKNRVYYGIIDYEGGGQAEDFKVQCIVRSHTMADLYESGLRETPSDKAPDPFAWKGDRAMVFERVKENKNTNSMIERLSRQPNYRFAIIDQKIYGIELSQKDQSISVATMNYDMSTMLYKKPRVEPRINVPNHVGQIIALFGYDHSLYTLNSNHHVYRVDVKSSNLVEFNDIGRVRFGNVIIVKCYPRLTGEYSIHIVSTCDDITWHMTRVRSDKFEDETVYTSELRNMPEEFRRAELYRYIKTISLR